MSKKSGGQLGQLLHQATIAMQKNLGACPEESELISYHLRELSEEEAENIREHLALCPRCVDKLKKIILFFNAVDEAPVSQKTPDEKRWEKLMEALGRRPSKNWVGWSLAIAASVLIVVLGGGYGLAILERPDYWTNPQYQNLVDMRSDLRVVRSYVTRSPENLKGEAIRDLADSSFSSARSKLLKYVEANPTDEEGHRLLAFAYLLTAKRTFLIDYGFDKDHVNQAIEHLQQAEELARDNPFAHEEISWLLGRAYAMLGNFEMVAKQHQAILSMTDPNLIKKAEARQALDDLAALITSLQPSPR